MLSKGVYRLEVSSRVDIAELLLLYTHLHLTLNSKLALSTSIENGITAAGKT